MASKKFFILDALNEPYDAVIKNRDKEKIGIVFSEPAPNGSYLNCILEGHWIVSDEDYKKLKQKNEKI